jgi:hypothetical protein
VHGIDVPYGAILTRAGEIVKLPIFFGAIAHPGDQNDGIQNSFIHRFSRCCRYR